MHRLALEDTPAAYTLRIRPTMIAAYAPFVAEVGKYLLSQNFQDNIQVCMTLI